MDQEISRSQPKEKMFRRTRNYKNERRFNNKKETYTCDEPDNIFVQFITHEKYHRAFTVVFMALLENL